MAIDERAKRQIKRAILDADAVRLKTALKLVDPNDDAFRNDELPLLFALKYSPPKLVRAILEAGADPNGRGLAFEILLNEGIPDRAEKARLLLEYGASIKSARNKEKVRDLFIKTLTGEHLPAHFFDFWGAFGEQLVLGDGDLIRQIKKQLIKEINEVKSVKSIGGANETQEGVKEKIAGLVKIIAESDKISEFWDVLVRDLFQAGGDLSEDWKKLLLREATVRHRWEFLEKLLQEGLDFKIQLENGQTLLHEWASTLVLSDKNFSSGAGRTLKVLLSAGLDIDGQDRWGNTPLHYACVLSIPFKLDEREQNNREDVLLALNNWQKRIEFLLKEGANPNIRNRGGRTPLFFLSTKAPESLKLLLSYKADPTIKDNDRVSLLTNAFGSASAVTEGELRFFHALLDAGLDPREKDDSGNTILTYLLWKLNTNWFPPQTESFRQQLYALVERALEGGVNPNDPGPRESYPIHLAVVDPELVRILLRWGADPNARGESKRTPAHMAAILSPYFPEVLSVLSKAGADLNAKDDNGYPPFAYWMGNLALEQDYESFSVLKPELRRLIALGVNPKDEAVLDLLVDQWRERIPQEIQTVAHVLRFLIEEVQMPVDIRNQRGNTLLHEACILRKPELAKFLLEMGSRPWVKNSKGETPGDILVQGGLEMPEWALELGMLPLKNEEKLLQILANEKKILPILDKAKEFVEGVLREDVIASLTLIPRLLSLPEKHPIRELAKGFVKESERDLLHSTSLLS